MENTRIDMDMNAFSSFDGLKLRDECMECKEGDSAEDGTAEV